MHQSKITPVPKQQHLSSFWALKLRVVVSSFSFPDTLEAHELLWAKTQEKQGYCPDVSAEYTGKTRKWLKVCKPEICSKREKSTALDHPQELSSFLLWINLCCVQLQGSSGQVVTCRWKVREKTRYRCALCQCLKGSIRGGQSFLAHVGNEQMPVGGGFSCMSSLEHLPEDFQSLHSTCSSSAGKDRTLPTQSQATPGSTHQGGWAKLNLWSKRCR